MTPENPTPTAAVAREEQDASVAGLTRMAGCVESVILRNPARSTVLDDLRELVAALERRMPRLEREGECDIARDASALKADALRRIRELEQTPADDSSD